MGNLSLEQEKSEKQQKRRFVVEKKAEMSLAEVMADMVRKLVDHPRDVNVREVGGIQSVVIEVTVNKADYGQVIGKKGIIADALRTYIAAVAGKMGKRCHLEILG